MKIVYNNRSGCVRICEDKTTKPVVGSSLGETAPHVFYAHTDLQDAITKWTDYQQYALTKYGQINTWDVSRVGDMSKLFYGNKMFNGDISGWNVSNVKNMNYMFYGATAFNQDISGWVVSNVKNMNSMFMTTGSFNQDISGWDVSSVTNMTYMFFDATAFNQDISKWVVSNVISYTGFAGSFNNEFVLCKNPNNLPNFTAKQNAAKQNACSNRFDNSTLNAAIDEWTTNSTTAATKYGRISTWDVGAVTSMKALFASKYKFNEDIGNWDVSNVTTMYGMFNGASNFNKPLNWANKVSNVTDMSHMFDNATGFNQNISGWDVRSVTDMSHMFDNATGFNQNISRWDVSSVTDMSHMFSDAHLFNQPLTWGAKVNNVTTMNGMFNMASVFNQDISDWFNFGSIEPKIIDMGYMFRNAIAFNNKNIPLLWGKWVRTVTNMTYMFFGATAFNQDISGWDVSSVIDSSNFVNSYSKLCNTQSNLPTKFQNENIGC